MRGIRPGLVILAAALLGSGCPIVNSLLHPPFDASGAFAGDWKADAAIYQKSDVACVVQFNLKQEPSSGLPASFVVHGTVQFNFSCPSVLNVVGDVEMPAAVQLPVAGALLPNGQLVLGSIENGSEDAYLLTIQALGADKDANGAMDTLSGTFTLYSTLPHDIAVNYAGSFDAARSS